MMNLIKKLLLVFSLLFIFVIILKSPIPESTNIGTGDFRPYWSASYLLANAQDFSDPGLMDNIERTLTGWNKPFTMMAWFAPTGLVILLPFTFLPFEKAAFFWLLSNILVLSATAILLWSDVKRKIWIPLLAVFAFPMTLLSLYVGQINTLVLFGLAVFISLRKPEQQYLRGIGLALTTIKPHLVILTLPLIILDCIYHKQWKILIGFFGSLLVCSVILFALYPSWPISFWNLVSSGMSTIRETPTISGLIAFTTGQTWGKWLWIPGLLFAISVWWFCKENLNSQKMFLILIPLSLLISPIGWGYDQIILLSTIIFILRQLKLIEIIKKMKVIIICLFSIYVVIFILRIFGPNEVWFFWVPLFIGTLSYFLIIINQKTNKIR